MDWMKYHLLHQSLIIVQMQILETKACINVIVTVCRVDEMAGVSYLAAALPFAIALVGGLILTELYVPPNKLVSWLRCMRRITCHS